VSIYTTEALADIALVLKTDELPEEIVAIVNSLVENEREDAYSDGHDDGYSEGEDFAYSEGFENGRSEGYDEGYDEGVEAGREEAEQDAA
jgi:flagellar assembly protein FliH